MSEEEKYRETEEIEEHIVEMLSESGDLSLRVSFWGWDLEKVTQIVSMKFANSRYFSDMRILK